MDSVRNDRPWREAVRVPTFRRKSAAHAILLPAAARGMVRRRQHPRRPTRRPCPRLRPNSPPHQARQLVPDPPERRPSLLLVPRRCGRVHAPPVDPPQRGRKHRAGLLALVQTVTTEANCWPATSSPAFDRCPVRSISNSVITAIAYGRTHADGVAVPHASKRSRTPCRVRRTKHQDLRLHPDLPLLPDRRLEVGPHLLLNVIPHPPEHSQLLGVRPCRLRRVREANVYPLAHLARKVWAVPVGVVSHRNHEVKRAGRRTDPPASGTRSKHRPPRRASPESRKDSPARTDLSPLKTLPAPYPTIARIPPTSGSAPSCPCTGSTRAPSPAPPPAPRASAQVQPAQPIFSSCFSRRYAWIQTTSGLIS